MSDLRAGEVPTKFKVRFTTTKGEMVYESNLNWAPQGAKRLYELVVSHLVV